MDLDLVHIIEVSLKGVGVGLASSVTVGPVAVLCIQRTLSKTRRSGLVSGIGVACADVLMALIAFFFYSMLQAEIDRYRDLLQVIAGIFVVAVGVYIFLQNPAKQIRKNRAGKSDLWQDFSSMFAFTLANFILIIPYLLAFFAMFDVGLDSTTVVMSSSWHSLFVMSGFFVGAVAWWFLLTLIIDLFRRRFRPRHMLTINHVAGVTIGVLGIYTILSTFVNILTVTVK
jgi:threonine/homoserine/homoserine lactone efflux protein